MRKGAKIFLIFNIILVSILVPLFIYYFYYYQYEKNQSQQIQSGLLLIPFIWDVKIKGSAIDPSNYKTYTWIEFERYSNLTKYVTLKGNPSESHTFAGFSLARLAYDLMNISTFSEIVIKGIDGFSRSFTKADIDLYKEELFFAYKEDGFPIYSKQLGGKGPVRGIVTQTYTFSKYGDEYNAMYCVKWISTIEINL